MKIVLQLGLLVFSLQFSSAAIQSDFSGHWTLADAFTRSSNVEILKHLTTTEKILTIKQTAHDLNVDRHQNPKTTETYAFEKERAIAVWVGEKLRLSREIELTTDNRSTKVKATELWTLSDDRKSLTIDLTVTTPEGSATYRLIYDKSSS